MVNIPIERWLPMRQPGVEKPIVDAHLAFVAHPMDEVIHRLVGDIRAKGDGNAGFFRWLAEFRISATQPRVGDRIVVPSAQSTTRDDAVFGEPTTRYSVPHPA